MGWIHTSHFTDNKLNDKCINDVTVDIGKNKDWSISDYLEDWQVTIEGDVYLDAITEEYYNDKKTQKQNKSRYTKTERWIQILPEKSFQTATSSFDCSNWHNSKIPQKQQIVQTIASNRYGMWRNWKIIHHQYNHFYC